MRAALRYRGDGSGDRAGVFAADLRRLRQVKCGNQFALPAGLLRRMLMNLSLSTDSHIQNNPSHALTHSLKHTFKLFPRLEGMRKQLGWSLLPSRLCGYRLHGRSTRHFQNSYRGNKVKVKPGVQPQLHGPVWTQTHTRGHIYSQEYTKQKPNTHLQPPHTGTDAPEVNTKETHEQSPI